jgi:hypothetical protein
VLLCFALLVCLLRPVSLSIAGLALEQYGSYVTKLEEERTAMRKKDIVVQEVTQGANS